MTPRPPWSRRKNPESLERFFALRAGIPNGLLNSLLDFVAQYFTIDYSVRIERTEHLARLTERTLPRDCSSLLNLFCQDEELLLDAIDHALRYPDVRQRDTYIEHNPHDSARTLKSHLADARSVYDVFHIKDLEYELGYRQPSEITTLIEDVVSSRTRAAEHLQRAWSLAFSRDPELNSACVEAAKAIEAAARDTIEPNNSRATLGTMIAAMKAKPMKWTTDLTSPDLDGIEIVINLMTTVWKGHLRHGNPNEPLDVTGQRCEMIVHTAALLVHWFSSGRVKQA